MKFFKYVCCNPSVDTIFFHNLTDLSDENKNYLHFWLTGPNGPWDLLPSLGVHPWSPFVNHHIFDISKTTGPILTNLVQKSPRLVLFKNWNLLSTLP
jgi:hypothetical protein